MGRMFLICDSQGREKGWIPDSASLDFEIGGENGDVKLDIEQGLIESGDFLICPGTEYGAILEELHYSTSSNIDSWFGNSFRKLLDQIIIEPLPGQDYRIVSGEANTVIKSLVAGKMGDFFKVSEENSKIFISAYQFKRYCTVLNGIADMLKNAGAKLRIIIESGEPNGSFFVRLEAAPIINYSDEYEFSEDSRTVISIEESRRGITHLICLGQGELKDRQVIHLYAWPNGQVKEIPYYSGLAERTEAYDYSSAESIDELRKGGIQRLKEVGNSQKVSVSVSNVELDIGDIVSGKSYRQGITVQVPIASKIIKVVDGEMTIEYRTEGS